MMILPRGSSARVPDSVLLLLILVVAASLGTVFAKDTAFVEVVLFESSPNGDYTTYTTGLQGRFSKAGATISAEGEIVQVRAKCPFRFLVFREGGMTSGAPGDQYRDAGCNLTELPFVKLFPEGLGGGGCIRRVCARAQAA